MNIVILAPTGDRIMGTHIAPADKPLLIGLNALDKFLWNVVTTDNILEAKDEHLWQELGSAT